MISKILVVDDEPDLELLIRQKFRRRIRKGEVEFLFAQNGVEALRALDETPDIDMVLSDINMPQMDGLTLLGQLRDVAPMIKAVIVSAYGDMQNIRTAMNRGAFDFVTKPIDFADLETTIEKTLDHLRLVRTALASRDQLLALRRELDVAARMQQQILPGTHFNGDGFEIGAHMTPAKEVGGDFYDYFRTESGEIGVVIADVSDKGVPAALFMAVSHTLIRARAIDGDPPGRCLERVNALLCPDNEEGMFVTTFVALLDPATGRLTYACAGHNPPVIVSADGTARELAVTPALPLGVDSGVSYEQVEVMLPRGDTLFLYTDGVTEAVDPDNEELGLEEMMSVLCGAALRPPGEMIAQIELAVARHADTAAQNDDLTCLAIRRPA